MYRSPAVVIYIVLLDVNNILDQLQQHRLLHEVLPSNHLQLEPVDIYTVQLDIHHFPDQFQRQDILYMQTTKIYFPFTTHL